MFKYKEWIMACLLFPLILLFINVGATNAQSSENFIIKKSVIDQGGVPSQSSQFHVTDAIGQSSAIGAAASENFRITAGLFSVTQGIQLTIPDTTGSPGSTIDIPVLVEDLTGQDILGLSFILETQTAVLTPIGANISGTLLEQWGSPTTNINGGQITIASAGTDPLTGEGVLVYIQYQVNPAAQDGQTTPVHFVSATLNEGYPLANIQDGLFTVVGGFNISGAVKYYANDIGVENTQLTLDGNTTLTDNSGQFSFAEIPGGNYSLKPSKSDQLGNSISAYDASFILRQVVGVIDFTPFQMIAGDVSGNGAISAYDASYVLRYVVGAINEFPVGEDWTFVPVSFSINESNWNSAPDSISYAPLNSDQSDQDFKAIIYADVSGNWAPSVKDLAAVPKNVTGTVSIAWGEVKSISQQEFIIPLCLDITGELLSVELNMSFDPDVLSFQGIIPGDNMKNFYHDYQITENQLKLALAGVEPVVSETDIFLKFETIDKKNKSETVVEITEIILNEGHLLTNLTNSEFSFNPTIPISTELFQNYPNPFNPQTRIDYQLHEKAQVKIDVYNLIGQKIKTLENKEQPAGHYSVMWDGCDELGNKVVSGIYLYQIHAGKFVKTRKMALMK